MADPSPQVGLPNAEWVELTNKSTAPVELKNWRLGDAGSQSGAFPAYTLLPDSAVIVCSSGSAAALSLFARTLVVTSFPSLDNDGDNIWLRSASGKTIHQVEYAATWHATPLKRDGGWSLEMIDTQFPCIGVGNWSSSMDPSGGTPGRANSIAGRIPVLASPTISRAYLTDPFSIVVQFTQAVDSADAAIPTHYTLSGNNSIVNALPAAPAFTTVTLHTANPFQLGQITLLYTDVINACGGLQTLRDTARVGLFSDARAGDVVINELLFNPPAGGSDYVELVNTGTNVVNAASLFLASVSASGTSSIPVALSKLPDPVLPGDYVVATADTAWLIHHYPYPGRRHLLLVAGLPSMPDDKGGVQLVGSQGEVLDEVAYQENWHFKLLSDREGVALERIDVHGLSQYNGNWHSAASTAGYGTPGYKNSQGWEAAVDTENILVTPLLFSPDNDGMDDLLFIRYHLNEPGFVASIHIFDREGKPVRTLVEKALLGKEGMWSWDGLDYAGHALSAGTYIIFIETFNLSGKRQAIKKAVVLTRKP